jgi:hypothetical protein
MRDEPNSRDGHTGPGPSAFDDPFPPELQALAQRLSADGSLWLSQLPDPVAVAERIRAIPATYPRPTSESESTMSTEMHTPPERGAGTQQSNGRPPRTDPRRGLLAALAAAVIVALLAAVIVTLAQRGATGPIGQPTPTQTQPGATPTVTQPASTPTPTTPPTGAWTTIQGFTAGGSYTSPNFDVTNPWRISWQCNRNMGNPGPYTIHVTATPASGPSGPTPVLDVVCQAGNTSGASAEITTPTGSVYLTVTSPGDSEWDLRIQVLR